MRASERILTLDIGSSKVVLAEFGAGRSGNPELLNYGVGRIASEPGNEADVSAFVVSMIRDLMRERGIRPAPLYMTISGQAVFPRYVKLPPVPRDKLLQIINYEAEQNVPFPIEEVVWDYQLIAGDDAGEGMAQELNVMLVAVKIESVVALTDCVQAAGLDPEIVDVAPMALYNTVRFNYPELEGCTMVLDIGARSSNLIFVEGRRIFSRSIPVAGNAITTEIAKEFEVSFKEAEELKLKHGFVAFGGVYAGPDSEVADRVSKIVRNVITRLHAEVNRSVNFYRGQQGGSAPARVLLCGGSSIIPHTDTFFREKMRVPVEHINPFQNVRVGARVNPETLNREFHLLGEVTGLALRRALVCPVEVNLMPPAIRRRKQFRRRQPFFALSAVGVILILLCWWFYVGGMRTVREDMQARVTRRSDDLRRIEGNLVKAADARKEAEGRLARVNGVVQSRTQWLRILGNIYDCLSDGMWVTAVEPVEQDGSIAELKLSGRAFDDRVRNNASASKSAFEELRDRIGAGAPFTSAEVVSQSKDDLTAIWNFTIRVPLKEPIRVK